MAATPRRPLREVLDEFGSLKDPNPDWQWARMAERGEFSESETKNYRNDLCFSVLGRGNLHAFPTWLRQVREKNGLDFDTDAADIRVGRKRAAAKLIAQWLER
ncbi:hypothetical protein AB9F47_30035 [Rhizobium leguminosarum]|uniref:hypothetical protein n=1 Tax=Rhizobium leguminosarum TaxID=384 RepID=UPI003F9B737A